MTDPPSRPWTWKPDLPRAPLLHTVAVGLHNSRQLGENGFVNASSTNPATIVMAYWRFALFGILDVLSPMPFECPSNALQMPFKCPSNALQMPFKMPLSSATSEELKKRPASATAIPTHPSTPSFLHKNMPQIAPGNSHPLPLFRESLGMLNLTIIPRMTDVIGLIWAFCYDFPPKFRIS